MIYLQRDNKIFLTRLSVNPEISKAYFTLLADKISASECYIKMPQSFDNCHRVKEINPELPELGYNDTYRQCPPDKDGYIALYERLKNIYFGTMRLLAEILGNDKILQDFGSFTSSTNSCAYDIHSDTLPTAEKIKILTYLIKEKEFSEIGKSYSDFVLFLVKVLPFINFDEALNEWSMTEFERLDKWVPNIAIPQNNTRILTLARSISPADLAPFVSKSF